MFDQLVVSSAAKSRKTRLRYFSVTAALWIAVVALVVVGGVWSYDARLSDTAKFISLGTPQPPVARGTSQPPPKKESNQPSSRPPSELVALEKPPDAVGAPRNVEPPIVPYVSDPGANAPGGHGIGGPVGNEHGVALRSRIEGNTSNHLCRKRRNPRPSLKHNPRYRWCVQAVSSRGQP